MNAGDDRPFLPDLPAEPGFRWVEVYDGRLTNRIRWDQVPDDVPDPEGVTESPEQVARTRRLVGDLVRRTRC